MLMWTAVVSIGALLGLGLAWYGRREKRKASSAVNQAFYGTPTPPVSSSTSSTSPPKSQTESPPTPARDRVCMFGNDMYVIQCVDGDDVWIRRVVGNGRVKYEPRKVSCRGVTVLGGEWRVTWGRALN